MVGTRICHDLKQGITWTSSDRTLKTGMTSLVNLGCFKMLGPTLMVDSWSIR